MHPVNGQPTPPVPYFRLLGAQLAIAAAAIFARYALTGAGPLAVATSRLGIAALVALALAGPFVRLSRRRELAFGAAGLALAIHFGTWIASLEFTSVAAATLLVTTTPLWTELYDIARERRPPSRAYLTSLGLALAGVAALVTARAAAPAPVPGHELLGDALALAGSVAIGAYLLIVRDAGAEPGRAARAARLGTRQVIARTYSWAALALAAGAAAAHQAPPALTDGPAWAGILAMALVSQMLGHTALNAALHDFSPSTISLTTLLEPVIAAAFAAAIFRELLTAQAVAGGLLVLAAVAVTLRDAARTA